MTLEQIMAELESIDRLQSALKSRAMVYQAEAKEDLARKHGKPIDSYYHLPYEQWTELATRES